MRWLSEFFHKFRLRDTEEPMVETVVQAKDLSRDDFRSFLDSQVRESLGMSLAEFMDGLAEGRIDPESPRVAGLAILVGARAR